MSDGAPASAISKADSKRLALSRDQRAVLEAVYAVEKLPDAALRDRLSKYLDLSTRQSNKACAQSTVPANMRARPHPGPADLRVHTVLCQCASGHAPSAQYLISSLCFGVFAVQVWFQNRRQRAKASGTMSPEKRVPLNTPTQIMDALFDYVGPPSADSAKKMLAAAQAHGLTGGSSSSAPALQRSGSSSNDGTGESPPGAHLDNETFGWGLPEQHPQHPLPPSTMQPGPGLVTSTHAPVAMRAVGPVSTEPPAAASAAAAPKPPAVWAATDILDAVLGFACHEMCLEAVELWPLPTASGPATEPLFAHFASPGTRRRWRPSQPSHPRSRSRCCPCSHPSSCATHPSRRVAPHA